MAINNVLDLSPEAVEARLTALGHKPFRARQVLHWLYEKGAADWQEMTSLSLELRGQLAAEWTLGLPVVEREARSADGSSKLLLRLTDGARIEMVLMPGESKTTLCVSSQVGCARGCTFCATARLGLRRSLTPGEMVGQVLLARRLAGGRRLTNIVLMGMGEPLDNLPAVLEAVRTLQHERGCKFSPRRITLSTCGVVPGIGKLAASGVKMKLAVSLNAALDAKRELLMPTAKVWPLARLKKALFDYTRVTPFRVTLEYIMMDGFNMGEEDIKALRRFCGDLPCKLNLIPWNAVPGLPWQSPDEQAINDFLAALQPLPVAVTLRRSRGADVQAACGQLAAQTKA